MMHLVAQHLLKAIVIDIKERLVISGVVAGLYKMKNREKVRGDE